MSDAEMMNTFRAAVQKGVKPDQQNSRSRSAGAQDLRVAHGVHGGFDALRSASVIRRF